MYREHNTLPFVAVCLCVSLCLSLFVFVFTRVCVFFCPLELDEFGSRSDRRKYLFIFGDFNFPP